MWGVHTLPEWRRPNGRPTPVGVCAPQPKRFVLSNLILIEVRLNVFEIADAALLMDKDDPSKDRRNILWSELSTVNLVFQGSLQAFQHNQLECRAVDMPSLDQAFVMDMVIFRTIFFELLVFFTFTLLTLHFAY